MLIYFRENLEALQCFHDCWGHQANFPDLLVFDFPSVKWSQLATQQLPESLTCILQRGTLTYFILACRTPRTNDGKGTVFEKSRSVEIHVMQCTDRNVIHWYLLGKCFCTKNYIKSIIIINRGVPVEHFCVNSIRKLLLIQTSRGILATNLGESSHSSSVAFITV